MRVDADIGWVSFDELLERAQAELSAIESPRLRERRAAALEHFAAYVELWKQATLFASERAAASPESYWLKLEFSDRRWTVHYQPLPKRPSIGETIKLGADCCWQVVQVQTVKPAPANAPERDYFVCAQAA